ncbi:hypothetical protein AVEN_265470-1 [Araneus ventricosus]|uniref:Uncharacterized protein n=1 Tax=Araneus ventricosus TaxID=182803 RepID=A0A4Y2CGJ3_ARAVE|nr:hypothetical protein AVEN_265470-1 [Araneus ventricosus]
MLRKRAFRNPIGRYRPSLFDAHQLRLIPAIRRSISQLITNPRMPKSGNRFPPVPGGKPQPTSLSLLSGCERGSQLANK